MDVPVTADPVVGTMEEPPTLSVVVIVTSPRSPRESVSDALTAVALEADAVTLFV
jgi:hypothetical protein